MISRIHCRLVLVFLQALTLGLPALAQDRGFAGVVAGFGILSGDGKSEIIPSSGAVSSYSPKTGAALNIFAGTHFSEYVSFQGNYIWNGNKLSITSARFGDEPASYFEQSLSSSQHSAIADLLLYFRNRESWARPFLSTGVGIVHLVGTAERITVSTGSLVPPKSFASNVAALRVSVGIDLRLHGSWYGRYTFGETISSNPISDRLVPPGRRPLKNFQNLFGVFRVF